MSESAFLLEHAPQLRNSVRASRVSDIVADKLAGMIASGTLLVGDVLPSERELASALHVSRESVRRGIGALVALGVLEVSQGARTRVIDADRLSARAPSDSGDVTLAAINRYALDEIHGARLAIERALVADAAELIDPPALAALEASLTAQRAVLDDPVRFIILDREFHGMLYRAAGNAVLADFVTDLHGYLMTHRRRAIAVPGAIARSVRDHEAIVVALTAGDRRAARRAIGRHIDRIYTTTHALLERRDSKRRDPAPSRVAP